MDFPAGQTALAPPTTKPSFIAVAVGTQNYTCGATGTYTNIGAVAELFDISCLYNAPAFGNIQDIAYDIWRVSPPAVTPEEVIALLHSAKTPEILGQHYYVPNPLTGVGVNPKWDFTSQGANAGNPNAFVVAAKVSGLSAPTGTSDIDWVSLSALTGELAQQVYRVDTKGGQPPATCTPGSDPIVVKYTAKYC
ncbi:putative malate dehydrogenase [Infundibulicybe gibba]|nr:putative malate dehydrogenase [Infundibulicybe gibba]